MVKEAVDYKVNSGAMLATKGEKSCNMSQLLVYEEEEGGHRKNGKSQSDQNQNK